ncbi:MAG: ABC transporter ATP-binding protein/permease, partial [Firmicutes bacterium]|nr:ABC transporter ATP-binding protein/permease [Bacillota bacterium]
MPQDSGVRNTPSPRPGGRPGGFGGGPGHGPRAMGGGKPKNGRATFKRLLAELKPARKRLILIICITVVSTVGVIFIPKLLAMGVNRIFGAFMGEPFEFPFIFRILITCLLLYALSSLLQLFSGMLMAGISQRTVYRMRKRLSEKLSKLPLKYYDAHTHGEVMSRITNDLDTVGNTLSQTMSQMIGGVVTVVGVFVMMLTINVWLTLILLAFIPISLGLMGMTMKFSQKYFAANQKRLGAVSGHIEEMFGAHKIVKAFNYEDKSIADFDCYNEELYEVGWKSQFFSTLIFPIMNFVSNFSYVLISVVGIIFVSKGIGNLQAGDVVAAFVPYAQQFMQPLSQIANIANVIQAALAASERIFEIYDEPEQSPEPINSAALQNVKGDIAFENVVFSYSPDKPLITGMNIAVKSGQVVAIVGPTGAGKTTIVNLLMKFYDITGGRITLDGADIADIPRPDLRQNLGMVLQDTWLFSGTVRENIAYGRRDATDEQIKEAAWAAQAHRFIKRMPEGYGTQINEEANNISAGQKQLLTIARALLADPKILILDEATSSVDTITEVHIQQAMRELMKNRTCFVIAHRLSTVRNADLILVMDKGD